ncbi:MAG TPA: GNAT family N-acetyltransferase [Micropepsaceae bacterium]|nr:GNAT family N-acetyltransferase [Micropepsaceae bacterium]
MNWFPLALDGFAVSAAAHADAPGLQALFESDAAYALLVEGRLPGPNAGKETITDRPENFAPEELAKLILRDGDGRIAAFVDLLRHYPREGIIWLGLVFVAPHARGGMGKKLMQALHATAARCGFDAMQLGVVEGNRAQQLYERLGYRHIRTARRPGEDGLVRNVFVMERSL